MLKPHKLNPGDRVAAISLSWGGAGAIPHRYEAGKRQLQEVFGVDVVETRHALCDPEWLRRHPEARADDLMEAFTDPTIKGIFSIIGGDDSIRLLRHYDLDIIRANLKVFLGYSDSTVTHLACLKAGLVSFYGPAIMAGFAENGGMFPYMIDAVRNTLFSAEPVGVIPPNRDGWTVERLDWNVPENQSRPRERQRATGWRWLQGEGVHEGALIGGCLEVLEWLRGTDVWPDAPTWQDAILFLETSEEAPTPEDVARALRVYAAMGILQRLSAILFGRPGGGLPVDQFSAYDDAILSVVVEEEGLTTLPIITNMDFGHTDPMFVLPLGVRARVDCAQQEFTIVEAAVRE
mgnify:CR=1 FL=1